MPRLRAKFIAQGFSSLATAAMAGFFFTTSTLANGRFPAAQMVQVGPGDRSDTVVVRTTFGILRSNDQGRSWSWLCEDLLGYGALANWDPPFAIAAGADGTALLVGLPAGLTRTLDGCTAAPSTDLGMTFTADVTSTADGHGVYWVGANGIDRNKVFFSPDGGRSFSQRGEAPEGVLVLTVEAAPSDAQTVYFTGVTTGPKPVDLFFRSRDGGRTLERFELDLMGAHTAWLSAVDPVNSQIVYLRAVLDDPDAGDPILGRPTLLFRSTDGGAHFTVLTRSHGPMLGFALSGDGRTVWTGGPHPDDRLRRSVDNGPFEKISDARALCLRWRPEGLYVCGDHPTEGYSLAVSHDDGRSVTVLLSFASLRSPVHCPDGTPGQMLCAPRWPVVARALEPPQTSLDAGTPPTELPSPRTASRESSGCAIAPTAPRNRGSTFVVVALVVVTEQITRRRASRRRAAP